MLAMWAYGAELDAPEVVVSGARWRALQLPQLAAVEAPGPRVVSRTVTLDEATGGVGLEVRWRLDSDTPGWFEAPLVGSDVVVTSLRYRGRDVGLADPQGSMRAVTLWVDGPGELVLTGLREARVSPGEGPVLPLLAAPRGTARIPEDWGFAADGMAPVGDGRWWGGVSDLAVIGREQVTAVRGRLVGATVAIGITVDDGAVQVAARLHATALRGTLGQVAFRVPGAGPDLVVEGPQVAKVDRQGDRVVVALRSAEARTARLDLRWSASTPAGAATQLAAPSVVPEDVVRAAYITKLARSGDREVVPDGAGWRATALAELPDWADGLVEGTATGALSFSGTGRGPPPLQLQLLHFEPVPGPATLIDVAQTAVALSDEGRMLMRTHLQVRNDRGAFLRVTPPPGTRIVGVSVAGELPEPLVDGRSWRLPLKKSVEAVDGLLSFPVRVVMVGDAPVFDGRTRDDKDVRPYTEKENSPDKTPSESCPPTPRTSRGAPKADQGQVPLILQRYAQRGDDWWALAARGDIGVVAEVLGLLRLLRRQGSPVSCRKRHIRRSLAAAFEQLKDARAQQRAAAEALKAEQDAELARCVEEAELAQRAEAERRAEAKRQAEAVRGLRTKQAEALACQLEELAEDLGAFANPLPDCPEPSMADARRLPPDQRAELIRYILRSQTSGRMRDLAQQLRRCPLDVEQHRRAQRLIDQHTQTPCKEAA